MKRNTKKTIGSVIIILIALGLIYLGNKYGTDPLEVKQLRQEAQTGI